MSRGATAAETWIFRGEPGRTSGTGCPWRVDRWAELQPALAVLELSTFQAPNATVDARGQRRRCPLLADGPAAERSGERGRAHLAAALANVVGPAAPVRAIVVEDLARGLGVLSHELGLPFDARAWKVVENPGPAAAVGPAVSTSATAAARTALALDIALYDAVRADAARRWAALPGR